MSPKDKTVLRDLATRYAEVCRKDVQQERRRLWRAHNSLEKTRPLIYLRGGVSWNEVPEITLQETDDPLARRHERWFRQMLYWESCNDDSVFEPWISIPAAYRVSGWGLPIKRTFADVPGGSWVHDPPLKDLRDLSGLTVPRHAIDEEATARNADRLREAIGDILEVDVDRGPAYNVWKADMSTDLGNLRGIQQLMFDMSDDPEGLHGLLRFMSEGIQRTHDEAEEAGDWGRSSGQNQAMCYAEELPDPRPNTRPVGRDQLWVFMAAQEYALIGPAMHDEFLLQYQKPIMEKFGLAAYGCCEDLTQKIDMLRQVRNLRRIAVSPMADVRSCAEQIGTDYVISWRPSPADMVGYGFEPERVRRITHEAMEVCRGLHVDITLKDAQTVQNDPSRLPRWVEITRQVSESY